MLIFAFHWQPLPLFLRVLLYLETAFCGTWWKKVPEKLLSVRLKEWCTTLWILGKLTTQKFWSFMRKQMLNNFYKYRNPKVFIFSFRYLQVHLQGALAIFVPQHKLFTLLQRIFQLSGAVFCVIEEDTLMENGMLGFFGYLFIFILQIYTPPFPLLLKAGNNQIRPIKIN